MWQYGVLLAICLVWVVVVLIVLIIKRHKDVNKGDFADTDIRDNNGLEEYKRTLNEEDIRGRLKNVFGMMLALAVVSFILSILLLAINEIAWFLVAFISFLFDSFFAIFALKAKKNPGKYSKYFFFLKD